MHSVSVSVSLSVSVCLCLSLSLSVSVFALNVHYDSVMTCELEKTTPGGNETATRGWVAQSVSGGSRTRPLKRHARVPVGGTYQTTCQSSFCAIWVARSSFSVASSKLWHSASKITWNCTRKMRESVDRRKH